MFACGCVDGPERVVFEGNLNLFKRGRGVNFLRSKNPK